MNNIEKTAASTGLRNLLDIVKGSRIGTAVSGAMKKNLGKTIGIAGGAGALGGGALAFQTGKGKGEKSMARKFHAYNQQENKYIARKAYGMGVNQSKQASDNSSEIDYDNIIVEIAQEKIASGHGLIFLNTMFSDEQMNKTASSQGTPINGYEEYKYEDIGDLDKMASATAMRAVKSLFNAKNIKKVKDYVTKAMDHIKKNKKLYGAGATGVGLGATANAMVS